MKNNKMHQQFELSVVVILVCAAMAVPMALAQSPAFNNGSLKGSYSFLMAKWTSTSSENAWNVLGIITFDGVGDVSGSYTENEAGTLSTGTLSGTYSVNSNGTGSITLTTPSGVTIALVIDASTKNIQLLETDCSKKPCDYVNSGAAIAQVSTSFSNASLKGAFGWLTNKWTSDPSQQAEAQIGLASFDGAGHMKVTGTDNTAGTVTTFKVTGTYSVNSDGTGSYALTDSKGHKTDGVLVINAAGKGSYLMHTVLPCGSSCGNMVMSGSATHQ